MDGKGLTLRRAMEQAAGDPRDNVIRFDASIFSAADATIRLDSPLVYAAPSSAADHGVGRDVIDGGDGTIGITGGHGLSAVLIVQRANLAMRNLKIAACGGRGVMLLDCESVMLDGCDVGSRGVGITILHCGSVEMRGGGASDNCSHGIELRDDSKLKVSGAFLRGNRQAGLALFDRARADLDACTIEANAQWGVVAAERSALEAVRTRVRRSGLANVDVRAHATVALDECSLADGGRCGIIVTGCARVTAVRTSIAGHGSRGMELQDDAGAELTECQIERSGELGAVMFDRSRVRITGGSISRNRGHAIVVRGRSAADVQDCAFDANQCSGISVPDIKADSRACIRRCVFRGNGFRPIARGPAYVYLPVPAVMGIEGDQVMVQASPGAAVDLYADPAGEASRYLRTVTADETGRFTLGISSVPRGEVVTATATTVDGQTSEFNVVAGRMDREILAALLARTGPLCDEGGSIADGAAVHRWRPGTKVVYHFHEHPPAHVEYVVRAFIGQVQTLVGPTVSVRAAFGSNTSIPADAVVVSIRRLPASDLSVSGTGGTTVTRWDQSGYLSSPATIVLADPARAEPVCPRVVIHEMCHALGLYHARVGLLSRMQGIPAPLDGYRNDFSPGLTFFDVAALQILYDRRVGEAATIGQLTQAGLMPKADGTGLARAASNR